ncbi:MAG: alkaline phosphatase family protein [Gammaproteobacteria bacterium]
MIRPDYTDLGIVNLMASLRAGLAAGRRSYGAGGYSYPVCSALPPERVRDHPKVFLVVIDGLGFDYLRRQTGAPWLNAHLAAALSSVYPPTTTSAITTFLTGEAPLQHGMLGWFQRFAEFSQVFAVLTGQARGGGAPLAERAGDLRRLLGHVAFGERIGVRSHVVAPAHIAGSPYNLAHLGPAELHPFEGLDAGVAACTRLARRPGRAYVYVYWHGLDATRWATRRGCRAWRRSGTWRPSMPRSRGWPTRSAAAAACCS